MKFIKFYWFSISQYVEKIASQNARYFFLKRMKPFCMFDVHISSKNILKVRDLDVIF
jgi:hypothetical protein